MILELINMENKTKIGLFFGSFNPIHVGHLIIANSMIELAGLDEVWLVVTPQNPFKINSELMDENVRLDLINIAIKDNPKLKSCDVEFGLPKPNYTIETLLHLQKKYKQNQFFLIIGEDNLVHFDKWKDYNLILNNVEVLVYPRPNSQNSKLKTHPRVHFYNCPMFDISSTYIRENLKNGKSIKYLVHEGVEKYILKLK